MSDRQCGESRSDVREPVLEASGLTKHFRVRKVGRAVSGTRASVVHALDDVSLKLFAGEITALVGESGSGKSTVAKVLAQLTTQTSGVVKLYGKTVRGVRGRALRRYVREVQIIFQDPFSSLNPTRTIEHHLIRPLRVHGSVRSGRHSTMAVEALLREVSLLPPEEFVPKFPHELSGGQRQRIAVARALACQPSVLLADEPVSMLDVSIRLGVLNLLARLVSERQLALLYITHDIASARYFAATTLVMYGGQIIEEGPSEVVTQSPAHPYTELLLASAPDPERHWLPTEASDGGEPASLTNPPAGCRFQPRCPHAMTICSTDSPPRSEVTDGHWVRCWLHVGGAKDTERQASGL